jgi:hypothetical protein
LKGEHADSSKFPILCQYFYDKKIKKLWTGFSQEFVLGAIPYGGNCLVGHVRGYNSVIRGQAINRFRVGVFVNGGDATVIERGGSLELRCAFPTGPRPAPSHALRLGEPRACHPSLSIVSGRRKAGFFK